MLNIYALAYQSCFMDQCTDPAIFQTAQSAVQNRADGLCRRECIGNRHDSVFCVMQEGIVLLSRQPLCDSCDSEAIAQRTATLLEATLRDLHALLRGGM